MAVTIEGLDKALEKFAHADKEVLKAMVKAARKASNGTVRTFKSQSPVRFKGLIKQKTKKTRSQNLYSVIGFLDKTTATGTQPKEGKTFDWYKAYWKNYGTLERRDPSHKFTTPVKPKARVRGRRNDVGQSAENFFRTTGWEDTWLTAFKSEMERLGYDLDKT